MNMRSYVILKREGRRWLTEWLSITNEVEEQRTVWLANILVGCKVGENGVGELK